GEKKEDTLISGIRVNGNYYGILLNVVKDPIYTTTGDTETFHIPRIKMTIMDQDKISTLSERSNFRFDLDSSSRDKTEPYERRIILDINYPGQPYGIKYENINQHLTHHFLIQEDIDFHQFMHIAKLFKSTLSKKEFSSYNIPGSQTTIE
ncbi:MAG: hypothetical protein EBV07_01665, partial [Proteobacteria bacterium]|nr:hypothetical protein [Pseudomonadota bacterium]